MFSRILNDKAQNQSGTRSNLPINLLEFLVSQILFGMKN